jgi:hypothetical protein
MSNSPAGWLPIAKAPKDRTAVDLLCTDDSLVPNMRRVDLGKKNVFYEPVQAGPSVVRNAAYWRPHQKVSHG